MNIQDAAIGAEIRAAIETCALDKVYAGSRKTPAKHALKGLDLTVPEGSVFGLLGPNGAGKSTFINILAGAVNRTSGSASICGYDITTHRRQASMSVGVVPQEITMDPFFTPREALELMAGFFGVRRSGRQTSHLLDIMGLGDKADSYVRQLSGGMKRRLMVAKAMVHSPPVLILDEPTAGVDVDLRRHLWEYIVRLRQSGVTIILTTHYLEEAQELCDTIAIINNGELIACEPTQDMLRRLDYKHVIIYPTTPVVSCPESLSDLDASVEKGGALSLTYRTGEIGIQTILDRVRDAGIAVCDLETRQPDLEDVFVHLTSVQSEAGDRSR